MGTGLAAAASPSPPWCRQRQNQLALSIRSGFFRGWNPAGSTQHMVHYKANKSHSPPATYAKTHRKCTDLFQHKNRTTKFMAEIDGENSRTQMFLEEALSAQRRQRGGMPHPNWSHPLGSAPVLPTRRVAVQGNAGTAAQGEERQPFRRNSRPSSTKCEQSGSDTAKIAPIDLALGLGHERQPASGKTKPEAMHQRIVQWTALREFLHLSRANCQQTTQLKGRRSGSMDLWV